MRTKLSALAITLLLAAAAPAAEERPANWIDHVRHHTLRTLRGLGNEIHSAVAALRNGMTGLKDGVTSGLRSITAEGRRGLANASTAVSQTSARAFRGVHKALLGVGRTVAPGVSQKAKFARPATARPIESPILAAHFLRGHDILAAWHLDLGDAPVRASLVLEKRLLLETTDHNLYCFEPRTGVLQWLYTLPAPSQSAYSADDQSVFVIAKDVYYEIDQMVGRPHRRIVLTFPASNPPTVYEKVVIINSWERRVIALDRETRVREWSFVPEDNVLGATPARAGLVYIPDVAGNLSAYSIAAGEARWTYKAHDAFRISPTVYDISLILPADDLFVHCVNRFSGLCHWKYPVQGPVTQPVWAANNVAYFSADGDAFYAVSAKEGKLLWRVPKGGWPVAVGRDNIYIQGPDSQIWCIDRKSGQKKWAVSAKPFTYFVRNTVSDHIFLGTDDGQVYALYLRGDHLEKKAKTPLAPGPRPKTPAPQPPEPAPAPGPSEGTPPAP